MIIADFIKALKAGNELADPSKWKKGQILVNTVGALVASVLGIIKWKFPDIVLPAGVEDNFVEIISSVLVIANIYLTAATTKKIGVK